MPRVRIIYDVDGWAYHRRALTLRRHAPPEFRVTMAPVRGIHDPQALLGDEPFDLMLMMVKRDVGATRAAMDARGWRGKLVLNWSIGWPDRADTMISAYPKADAVILTNRGYWDALGRLPRTWHIGNGVDFERFNLQVPLEQRSPRVLWTGSQLHRRIKGYDEFMVPLQRDLRERGIDCELLLVDSNHGGSLSWEEMARWYNRGTVLVCASESEGTPNPALEAAACGCTIVSTRVGNMPELIRHGVNGYLVERDRHAMLEAVTRACARHLTLASRLQHDIAPWDWPSRAGRYFEVFRQILAEHPLRAGHAPAGVSP